MHLNTVGMKKIFVVFLCISNIVLYGTFFYPGYPNYVLLPLLIFLAAAEPKWARTTTVLSGITGIILMLFISSNLFPYQEILMITGIYVSVRSTSKLKEAYQKSKAVKRIRRSPC